LYKLRLPQLYNGMAMDAINKGNVAYFSLRVRKRAVFSLPV